MDKSKIIQEAKKELARREFFFYCNVTAPDFYTPEREFLVEMCNDMQEFMESNDDVCIINIPPRHGKSRTCGKLVEWVLGKDRNAKIMTGSYNETLSTVFAKNVRNTIMEEKADSDRIVYSDIFPKTKIKHGDGAMNLWSLEGGYNNYLATSPTGTATGFGCSLMIIDDVIKSAKEAYNASILEGHWEWFANTMLSRLEEGGKMLIVMTRWANNDLAGKVMDWCKKESKKFRIIKMRALKNKETHEMLCPEILSYNSYLTKCSAMGADIVEANYNQEPIDIKGKLYTSFKTYDHIPTDSNGNSLFTAIKSYTDTADEGADYLCSIIYGVYEHEAYVLDVIYTQEPMEVTETLVAEALYREKVNVSTIESNNGGKGFARAVERILKDKYHWFKTHIEWFHQGQNKTARILSNSTWIMNHLYYPANWRDRWPEYFDAMNKYQKEGKNIHDDAPDCTTGVAENMDKGARLNTRIKGGI